MRWITAVTLLLGLVAAAGCGYQDREFPDVVWEDSEPYCPHCRTDVNWYATVCYTCFRDFDWVPGEETCSLCLSQTDADWQRVRLKLDPQAFRDALKDGLRDLALPPDVVATIVPEFILYVESLDAGDCTFCAGTGRWLAPAMTQTMIEPNDPLLAIATEEMGGDCPVCSGTGKCILCRGDHRTEIGDEAAVRGTDEVLTGQSDLDPMRDVESAREFFRRVREMIERHAGAAEIAEASSFYSAKHDQVDWAGARLDLIREALPEEDD